MQALRIQIAEVIDFGSTVVIVGTDHSSNQNVVLHIDYRPLYVLAECWAAAGLTEQTRFRADDLRMRLDLDWPPGPGGGVELSRAA